MTKFLTLLTAGILVFLVGYSLINKRRIEFSVSPSAEFDISKREIEILQKQAISGDCNAAYRLANYHSSFTLNSEEAMHWLRMAVKCPDVNPKLQLIALLLGDENPDSLAEVDRLVLEIRKTDPDAAKRAQDAVRDSRSRANSKRK